MHGRHGDERWGPAASPLMPPEPAVRFQPKGPMAQRGDGHRDLLHDTEGPTITCLEGFARSRVRAGRAGPSWCRQLCHQDSRWTFQPLPRVSNTPRGTGMLQTATARRAVTHRPRLPPSHLMAQLGVLGHGHAWAWKGNSMLREPPKSLPKMRVPPSPSGEERATGEQSSVSKSPSTLRVLARQG